MTDAAPGESSEGASPGVGAGAESPLPPGGDRSSRIEIERFELGPFATNCYVVWTPGAGSCWIADASFDIEELIVWLDGQRLRPEALVLTHAHVDHIAGVEELRREFPGLPVHLHEAERDWLGNPMLNLSAMMGVPVVAGKADRLLTDREELRLGGESWQVLHTPGHSPGGVCLYHAQSGTAVSGDALFAGSVGRTDFPGSDHDLLVRSIRERLYVLPDDTRVFPGHGPPTTIGREKRTNPFVRA